MRRPAGQWISSRRTGRRLRLHPSDAGAVRLSQPEAVDQGADQSLHRAGVVLSRGQLARLTVGTGSWERRRTAKATRVSAPGAVRQGDLDGTEDLCHVNGSDTTPRMCRGLSVPKLI